MKRRGPVSPGPPGRRPGRCVRPRRWIRSSRGTCRLRVSTAILAGSGSAGRAIAGIPAASQPWPRWPATRELQGTRGAVEHGVVVGRDRPAPGAPAEPGGPSPSRASTPPPGQRRSRTRGTRSENGSVEQRHHTHAGGTGPAGSAPSLGDEQSSAPACSAASPGSRSHCRTHTSMFGFAAATFAAAGATRWRIVVGWRRRRPAVTWPVSVASSRSPWPAPPRGARRARRAGARPGGPAARRRRGASGPAASLRSRPRGARCAGRRLTASPAKRSTRQHAAGVGHGASTARRGVDLHSEILQAREDIPAFAYREIGERWLHEHCLVELSHVITAGMITYPACPAPRSPRT